MHYFSLYCLMLTIIYMPQFSTSKYQMECHTHGHCIYVYLSIYIYTYIYVYTIYMIYFNYLVNLKVSSWNLLKKNLLHILSVNRLKLVRDDPEKTFTVWSSIEYRLAPTWHWMPLMAVLCHESTSFNLNHNVGRGEESKVRHNEEWDLVDLPYYY